MNILETLQQATTADFSSYLETIQDSKKQQIQNTFENGLKGAAAKIADKMKKDEEIKVSSADSKVIYLGICITFIQNEKIVKCDIGLSNNKFWFLVS